MKSTVLGVRVWAGAFAAVVVAVGACGGAEGGGTPKTPPPSGLAGEKMGSGFHLTWKDNSTDEEAFVVEQKVGSGAFSELTRVTFNTTQYHVPSGEPGKMYTFRVVAKTSASVSDPSNEVMWMP